MNRIWTPEYAAEFDVTDPGVREFIETRYLPYYRAEIAELTRKVAEGDQEAVDKRSYLLGSVYGDTVELQKKMAGCSGGAL